MTSSENWSTLDRLQIQDLLRTSSISLEANKLEHTGTENVKNYKLLDDLKWTPPKNDRIQILS